MHMASLAKPPDASSVLFIVEVNHDTDSIPTLIDDYSVSSATVRLVESLGISLLTYRSHLIGS